MDKMRRWMYLWVLALKSRALKHSSSYKEQRGFTLVEVIVAALLIGIVSSGIISYAIFTQNNVALIKEKTQQEFMAEEISQLMLYESICTDTLEGINYPIVTSEGGESQSIKERVHSIREQNVVSGEDRFFYQIGQSYGDIDFAKILLENMWIESPFDKILPTSQQCHYRYKQKTEENVVLPFLMSPVAIEEAFPIKPQGKLVTAVAAGVSHTCAVQSGNLKCWGDDDDGQLGDGDRNTNQSDAGHEDRVVLEGGVTAVAAGASHTCAIQNGGLKCWGLNTNGQLGLSGTGQLTPTDVPDMATGVTAVAAGASHTCAIQNGGLKCWGLNTNGQLGDNSRTQRTTPTVLRGLGTPPPQIIDVLTTGVTAVAAGASHTCAIQNGGLKCWGLNTNGQLGLGDSTERLSPTDVPDMATGVKAVAAGASHTCAIQNGNLRCWGSDTNGRLGDGGTDTELNAPPSTAVLTEGVTAVAAGGSHTCAVRNGNLRCWGDGTNNQLGDIGNTTNRGNASDDARVVLERSVTAVAAGGSHTCAIQSGNLRCWGSDTNGRLGDVGNTTNRGNARHDSRVVLTGTGISIVALLAYHTCAIQSGNLKCWGEDDDGQLGDGDRDTNQNDASHDDRVVLTEGVTAVAAGWKHTCAIQSGNLKCWGDDTEGRLGDGDRDTNQNDASHAARVVLTGGVTAVSADMHTCAVRNGNLRCWGPRFGDKLGDGVDDLVISPDDASRDDRVVLRGGVTAVSAGRNGTCAVRNGNLRCWGNDIFGALGDGDKNTNQGDADHEDEARVVLRGGVTAVSMAHVHTCAIQSGNLKCWGEDTSGQLGDGDRDTNQSDAGHEDRVVLTGGVTAVSTGVSHTCAIQNGNLMCWGRNEGGGLGDGTIFRNIPGMPVLTGGVTAVVAAGYYTCAIQNGNLRCWGGDFQGVLGDGNFNTNQKDADSEDRVISYKRTFIRHPSIAAGGFHTCALRWYSKKRKEAYCWGFNSHGILGQGGTHDGTVRFETPRKVKGVRNDPDNLETISNPIIDFKGLYAGYHSTCAIRKRKDSRNPDESVKAHAYCWGDGAFGRMGLGKTEESGSISNNASTYPQILQGHRVDGDTTSDLINFEWTFISIGKKHACGIRYRGGNRNYGKAYCWGLSSKGLLGTGEKTGHGSSCDTSLYTDGCYTPNPPRDASPSQHKARATLVAGPNGGRAFNDWVYISAGVLHTCGLRMTGEIYCWGFNRHGQLGSSPASSTPAFSPRKIDGDKMWKFVSAGHRHTCAIDLDGGLYCWGSNDKGQLGLGTSGKGQKSATPQKVNVEDLNALDATFQQVSVGREATCAISETHKLYCWGDNQFSQLGLSGAEDIQAKPQRVNIEDKDVDEVSVGYYHTCASVGVEDTLNPKKLYCWGGGTNALNEVPLDDDDEDEDDINAKKGRNYGQVGDGYRKIRNTPVDVLVELESDIVYNTMALGGFTGTTGHTCLLHREGYVTCVGKNGQGQLGVGDKEDKKKFDFVTFDTDINGVTNKVNIEALHISAGRNFSCALTPESKVRCWGASGNRQLGNPDVVNGATSPVWVKETASKVLSHVRYIASGELHTCAILLGTGDSLHTAKCWGYNSNGQLGTGDTVDYHYPVPVKKMEDGELLSEITQISGGEEHTCAISGGQCVLLGG